MGINNALDNLILRRQKICDHNYQDRVKTPNKTYCGKCGLEEK